MLLVDRWLSRFDALKRVTTTDWRIMTVRELQQQLSKLDPDLNVLCCSEDEKLLAEGQLFRLLDIVAVSTMDGERVRLDDRTPYLKLGKSLASEALAVLDVTSDF